MIYSKIGSSFETSFNIVSGIDDLFYDWIRPH